ncbi:DUF1810 domain-containing protein [Noviherbaspirillum saxi]|uniref:DUF1810 domain-containing protein n=1 Tax=Noviherbaspirillum saxi TaxID=2320863 RepID=A0A3A3FH27_9BURK|nr:DUF1810 domain-containing protein [Noviherbaspirillum saxi]RJF92447.1 DUF1810 domain-containing protein [Noviherbaspirillum saxi]
MSDPHHLQRFILAQDPVYEMACEELRQGYKRTHWMWFIFPQLAGLGHSEMARRYAIASIDEAHAYLGHPVLGSRLRECCRIVLGLSGRSANEIFGYPDDMKFHSSLTLFSHVTEEGDVFDACLAKYFDGEPDQQTLNGLQ